MRFLKWALGCAMMMTLYLLAATITPAYCDDSPGKETLAPAQLSSLGLNDAFKKGVDLFLSREYNQAEGVFRYLVQQQPTNAEYICWLAQTVVFILGEKGMKGASPLSMLPDGREVRSLYEKAAELDPHSERARIGKAVILRDIPFWLGGSVDKAETMLQDVLKENPQSISALHFLGTLYIKKRDDYQKGIEYLQKALDIANSTQITPEEHLKLARTYHALGDAYLNGLKQPDQAIPHLEESVKIDGMNPVALLDLSDAYQQVGQVDSAKETLRKAAQVIQENQYDRFNKDLAKAARKLDMKKELNLR